MSHLIWIYSVWKFSCLALYVFNSSRLRLTPGPFKVYRHNSHVFLPFLQIFLQGQTTCVSSALLPLENGVSCLKERICSLESKFFPSKVHPHLGGRQNENGSTSFLQSLPIHLKADLDSLLQYSIRTVMKF